MRLVLLMSLRVVFGVGLAPVCLLLVLLGGLAVFCGAVGAVAWLIQLFISLLGAGSGGGPLSPAVMLLLCAVAVPAGWMLLSLASLADPRAQHDVERQRPPVGDPADDAGARQGPEALWRRIATLAAGQRTVRVLPARPEQVRVRIASRQAIGERRGRRGEH